LSGIRIFIFGSWPRATLLLGSSALMDVRFYAYTVNKFFGINFFTFIFMNTSNVERMSDKDLYLRCKRFGTSALEARRKFEGLLPEVNRRLLYERKGFNSIFEFAAKLAGLNKEQVQRVLQLERKFEDKPVLKEALVNGEVSYNKLARVASIATKENQEELVAKAKVLPKSALDIFVKDVRIEMKEEEKMKHGLFEYDKNDSGLEVVMDLNSKKADAFIKPKNACNSVSGHRIDYDLELIQTLSGEVKSKLIELKEKGLDINAILLELLQRREEEIAEEKEKLAQKEIANRQINKNPSRYINVRIKKLIHKEHGIKCSIPGCNKPSKTIHHTQRFALSHTHDPRFLAPLCREHHQIAHSIDIKYQDVRRL